MAVIACIVAPRAGGAQDAADVVRGRVVDEKGQPIQDAQVTVQDSLGGKRNVKTNKDGRYTALFQVGSGNYTVSVISLGKKPARKSISRVADEAVLIADIVMQPVSDLPAASATLKEVKVVASKRQKATRENEYDAGPGSRSEWIDDRRASPADANDPSAFAKNLPGVYITPDGRLSVFGSGPGENSTTLNGMSVNGATLPAGIGMRSLTTSSYDASVGGFSGAQTSYRVTPGMDMIQRSLSMNLDAPMLQGSSQASSQLGQEFGNTQFNYVMSGPVISERMYYNGGLRFGRRWNDLTALGHTGDAGLRALGLSPDSLQRLTQLLQSSNVPLTPPQSVSGAYTNNIGGLWRFDLTPPQSTRALNTTFSFGHSQSEALGAGPSTFLSSAGKSSSNDGSMQVNFSTFIKELFLFETRSGFSFSRSSSSPYLGLPSGQVLINSTLPDGTLGSSMVQFGGNSGLSSSSSNWTWQTKNDLAWFTIDNKHRLKLGTDVQVASISSRSNSNLLGTYTYNSLADFEAGTPTSFTRTLDPIVSSARALNYAASLGDAWRLSQALQFQYGLRFEGTRYFDRPAFNPVLDSLLGARTDRVPNSVYLSPRAGFTWMSVNKRTGMGFSPKMMTVSGGVGLFRNTPGVGAISGPMSATGLPTGPRQLTCLGSVIPTPDWSAFASNPSSIPDQCLNGTTPSVLADQTPSVQLFDPSYDAARSFRTNLRIMRYQPGWSGSLDLVYSRGIAQQQTIDLNFNNTPRFTLPDEGGRPVFVTPTSIVPATGAVSSVESRITNEFSSVRATVSDGRSIARQATISFSKTPAWDGRPRAITMVPNISYTLGSVRSFNTGFSGSTGGSPFDADWGRSSGDVRHQFQLGLDVWHRAFQAMIFGTLRSGTPYTPIVGGDISGDGLANDRAFIPDPATIADPTYRTALTSALANMDASARECLTKQFGKIAAQNSCTGPWSKSLDMSLTLNTRMLRMSDRVSVSAYVSNLLGGLDRMFHGADDMRGWGASAFPDSRLLIPRGFDAANHRFAYDVNPRFGNSKQARAFSSNPFRITLTMSVSLAPSWERQSAQMMVRRARKSPKDSVQNRMMLKQQLSWSNLANSVVQMMTSQDSVLNLSEEQKTKLKAIQTEAATHADSVVAPIVDFVMAKESNDVDEDLMQQIRALRKDLSKFFVTVSRPKIVELITPEQRAKLPTFLNYYLSSKFDPEAMYF